MRALIDADVLRYEVGSVGQIKEGEDVTILSFDYVARVLDEKVEAILDACTLEGVRPTPVMYLSGKTNFRDDIAVSKKYKGNRKSDKPWHFDNLTVYIKNQYETVISEGCEADDMMAAEQYKTVHSAPCESTVICTRDKDLRMIPGWHYGWECGAQREVHLHYIEPDGYLRKRNDGKVEAGGMRSFYYQLLIGDDTDNIPGCPGVGPAKAYKILSELDPPEMLDAVVMQYLNKDCTEEYLLEQGQLLWMTREFTPDGRPVLWQLPSE